MFSNFLSNRRPIFPITALVFVAGTAAFTQSPEAGLSRRYRALEPTLNRASKAVGEGRFEEAQNLLKPCLKEIPDHFEVHYLLARMAYETRDFANALAHMETAERSLLELDRRMRERKAQMEKESSARAQEAKDNLSTVMSRTPDPTGFSATTISSLKNDIHALEANKGPLTNDSPSCNIPADYRFLKGNALLRLGRREEARAQYRLAVDTEPSHSNAWNNLIALLLGAGNPAEARAALAKAEAAHATIQPGLKAAVLKQP